MIPEARVSSMSVAGTYRLHATYQWRNMLTYAGIPSKPSILASSVARAYLPPLASNTLLVPSRLAFLQRSTSGTVLPAA